MCNVYSLHKIYLDYTYKYESIKEYIILDNNLLKEYIEILDNNLLKICNIADILKDIKMLKDKIEITYWQIC